MSHMAIICLGRGKTTKLSAPLGLVGPSCSIDGSLYSVLDLTSHTARAMRATIDSADDLLVGSY